MYAQDGYWVHTPQTYLLGVAFRTPYPPRKERMVIIEKRTERIKFWLTDKELKQKKHDEAELQKAIARNDTVSHLYEKLYEDNAVGKVSDEWFMQLSHKYETERLELKTKIKTLRQKLSECGQREQERENFTSAIRRFMRMDRLTAPLLRELIDHIDVFETEGKGKNRTQRIVIYYRFVGYVEIPEVSRRPNIVADTRKGVATKYLTEPKTA